VPAGIFAPFIYTQAPESIEIFYIGTRFAEALGNAVAGLSFL
jgi:hypothetical protein